MPLRDISNTQKSIATRLFQVILVSALLLISTFIGVLIQERYTQNQLKNFEDNWFPAATQANTLLQEINELSLLQHSSSDGNPVASDIYTAKITLIREHLNRLIQTAGSEQVLSSAEALKMLIDDYEYHTHKRIIEEHRIKSISSAIQILIDSIKVKAVHHVVETPTQESLSKLTRPRLWSDIRRIQFAYQNEANSAVKLAMLRAAHKLVHQYRTEDGPRLFGVDENGEPKLVMFFVHLIDLTIDSTISKLAHENSTKLISVEIHNHMLLMMKEYEKQQNEHFSVLQNAFEYSFYAITMMLSISVVVGLILYWIIHRTLISRLKRLIEYLYLDPNQHDQVKCRVQGDDELSLMARKLEQLRSYQVKITEQSVALKQLTELQKDLISISSESHFELDHDDILITLYAREGADSVSDILGLHINDATRLAIHPNSLSQAELFMALIAQRQPVVDLKLQIARDKFPMLGWCMLQAKPCFDENGDYNGYRGIIQDVNTRHELERRLEAEATTDFLTGINNRRAFLRQSKAYFSRMKRQNTAMCFAILDIDNFKRVNDTHGHDVGDVVIQHLANFLVEHFRASDLVARFGGEEFGVLLPDTAKDAAFNMLEQRRRQLEAESVTLGKQQTLKYTVSIGVSEVTPIETTLDDVFKRADRALYISKQSGRNQTTLFD
ncbi:sensor domain-containing diguanylate cyclase [Echinimonas agarilytica]|uniref:diguanylate cyclase n=1 Tax=Echinimonas agarilytica TaxID=1215918 RepID=A0AA41W8G7_9GAMM|nr:GGDEF domain-containing protein [Echinimonas agarilytica]MCM2681177.1 GGDEF domain-containing protein [Echinimonas agarilytica]